MAIDAFYRSQAYDGRTYLEYRGPIRIYQILKAILTYPDLFF